MLTDEISFIPSGIHRYNVIHSAPSMNFSDTNGFACSSVRSLDHGTLPAKVAPGPLHLYCP